jgi:hypothetical protein
MSHVARLDTPIRNSSWSHMAETYQQPYISWRGYHLKATYLFHICSVFCRWIFDPGKIRVEIDVRAQAIHEEDSLLLMEGYAHQTVVGDDWIQTLARAIIEQKTIKYTCRNSAISRVQRCCSSQTTKIGYGTVAMVLGSMLEFAVMCELEIMGRDASRVISRFHFSHSGVIDVVCIGGCYWESHDGYKSQQHSDGTIDKSSSDKYYQGWKTVWTSSEQQ